MQCITSSHSQEADTDDQQGTLTYEEFSVFYRMMSLRRDLFLLMMSYSDRKDHLTAEELANFLRNEQKVRGNASIGAGQRSAPELLINPRRSLWGGAQLPSLLHLTSNSLRLSCLPRGMCSTKTIYHSWNWFVSWLPSSCSFQFFFAVFFFLSCLTHSFLSYTAMLRVFITPYLLSRQWCSPLILFSECSACLSWLTN